MSADGSSSEPVSVAELIRQWSERFTQAGLVFGHGTDNAWDEATAMVLAVTGFADDAASLELPVDPEDHARICAVGEQRTGERIPLAYLVGEWPLAGVPFFVEPGVVVPRSPIAHFLTGDLPVWLVRPPLHILDLCTGSGCLGILAALVFPAAQVMVVDLSPQAAALAQRNVDRHNLGERVQVFCGDLYAPLPRHVTFDLIIANPPYVHTIDMRSLPREFAHEPAMGLAGGDDGLDLMTPILAGLPARLHADGLFVGEVGRAAPDLVRRYAEITFVWPDLEGGEGIFLLEGSEVSSHTAALQRPA